MSRNSKRISVGRQLSCQSLCAENGPPSIFLPPLKQTLLTPKFQLHELGEPSPNAPRKTIVIVGATGSGKSTLINGLFNHVVGVSWEDQFRFRLVQETSGNQAKSQTQRVTVYTVHHRKGHAVPYTLTVVDTPGFGDTAGVLKDNKIADQLRAFFNSADKTGINRIDAVGFVVQASLPRLTVSQQYTFDSILALFGKDIAKNIYFLITFADARTPQVMSGILEAKLPHEGFFKFNNSVLFTCKPKEDASQHDASDDEEDDSEFNEIYWKMGTKSYKSFLDTLGRTESRSLEQTQAVIQERRTLELCVRGLQTEIRLGMNKLEQLEEERAVLAQLEGEMERTRDSTYTVHEESVEAVPVTAGESEGSLKGGVGSLGPGYSSCPHSEEIFDTPSRKIRVYCAARAGACAYLNVQIVSQKPGSRPIVELPGPGLVVLALVRFQCSCEYSFGTNIELF